MRLTKPRVQPVDLNSLTADQKEVLAPMIERGRVLNVMRTLVNSPKATKGFLAWAGYVLSRRNDLPARQREIVILRIGFLCKSGSLIRSGILHLPDVPHCLVRKK